MFSRARILCALAATALVFAATQRASATIDVIDAFSAGLNQLQDTSADTIVGGTGYNNSAGTGAMGSIASGYTYIGSGTILVTAFALNTIQQGTSGPIQDIGTGSSYNQLTGLAVIQCLSLAIPGSSSSSYIANFGAVSLSGSTDGILNQTLIGATSTATSAAMASWGANTLVGLYDGSPTPFSRTGSGSSALNADIASATGGAAFLDLGFAGSGSAASGTGWQSQTSLNNLGLIGNIPAPGNGGTVNYALVQTATTGYSSDFSQAVPSTFNPLANVLLNGSSNLLGTGGAQTPFYAFDNADIVLDYTPVPEPASICVWLGAALIGGYSIRRRFRAGRP